MGNGSCMSRGDNGEPTGRVERTRRPLDPRLPMRRRRTGPAWLWAACALTSCSNSPSSATSSSALLPESSVPSSTAAEATSHPDSLEQSNSSDRNSASSEVTETFSTGVSSAEDRTSSAMTTTEGSLSDGGAVTLDTVDGQLPSLSPSTEATCGIPVPNGTPLCDPVAQCGCNAGQSCAFTPERSRLFTCVRPGNTPLGDRCDADDVCMDGAVCVSGLCVATCRYDDECGAGTCVPVSVGQTVVQDLRVCGVTCDPLDPGACGLGATCANASGTANFTCVRQAAVGGLDASCSDSKECGPGLGCALDGSCRPWCSLDGLLGDVVTVLEGETASANEPAVDADAGSPSAECPDFSECLAFSTSTGLGLCGQACPVPDIPGSECSVLTGCGCSAGETCQVNLAGVTACNPPGTRSAMGWCNDNDDCGVGLSCIGALCRPVCDPDSLPCADGSGCFRASTAESSPSACLGHCDPVETTRDDAEFTPCGLGAYCAPGFTPDSSLPESHCTRQSDVTVANGGACTGDYQCRNGSGCDPETNTCREWCRSDDDCSSGQLCDVQLNPLRTGAAEEPIGICRTP
jgi:hypothetical protein